jgi:hypothetical protein
MTELALRARSAAGVRLVRRFSPVVKANRAFWAALWVAAAAGTAGSLALFVVQRNLPVDPVQVVLRLVGARSRRAVWWRGGGAPTTAAACS